MAPVRSLCIAPFIALTAGVSVQPSSALGSWWNFFSHGRAHHATSGKGSSFLRNDGYDLKLRVCNAFPSDMPFEVYHNEDEIKKELEYKSCFEYKEDLRAGDRMNFKVQGLATGSFTIDDLPTQDATLVLVVARHDSTSMAVSFRSHVFANLASPQIALIDTYQGKTKGTVEVKEAGSEDSTAQTLEFNSVAAVNEGSYKVMLKGAETQEYSLDTSSEEAYILIRCGVESELGTSWKQELIVFPKNKATEASAPEPEPEPEQKKEEKAGAREAVPSLAGVLLLVVACMQN
eukprot:gb/GFBE01046637.1/.p1 GENE.gb/GFBE01046637.1/~~gb/GFBE01046637.1/.p1  ORF type:complete len:290 (+),score=85.11 gb/GFBE01046637.1/:1-870(+)